MDDLGTEMFTKFVKSAFYRIVNDRLMSRRKTVLSTNLPVDEGEEGFPQPRRTREQKIPAALAKGVGVIAADFSNHFHDYIDGTPPCTLCGDSGYLRDGAPCRCLMTSGVPVRLEPAVGGGHNACVQCHLLFSLLPAQLLEVFFHPVHAAVYPLRRQRLSPGRRALPVPDDLLRAGTEQPAEQAAGSSSLGMRRRTRLFLRSSSACRASRSAWNRR